MTDIRKSLQILYITHNYSRELLIDAMSSILKIVDTSIITSVAQDDITRIAIVINLVNDKLETVDQVEDTYKEQYITYSIKTALLMKECRKQLTPNELEIFSSFYLVLDDLCKQYAIPTA